MGNWFTPVLDFLKELIRPITMAISSFLIYKQGQVSEQKKALEEHLKDATEAQKLKDHLNSLPSDDLDNILSGKPKGNTKA